MENCPQCGRPILPDSIGCHYCATSALDTVTPKGYQARQTSKRKPTAQLANSRICAACRERLDADALFCPSCRTPVLAGGMTACPKCKKSINPNSTFCKYCGADLKRSKPKKNAGHILIVAGSIIAIVSAVGYLWAVSYAGNFANYTSSGFSNLVGRRDWTYDLVVNFGPFTFLAGIILLVAGLVIRHNNKP